MTEKIPDPAPLAAPAASQAAFISAAPQFYCNGLGLGSTLTEIILLGQFNNQTVAQISFCLPAAKSLLENLTKLLDDYNQWNGPVLSMDELAASFKKFNESSKK